MNRKIKESLPGCIGLRKPIPPNRCDDCRFHNDPKIDCGIVRAVRLKTKRS